MNYIKKNFMHFANFFNYIIEHLLCIILLILVLVLSGYVLVHLPVNNPEAVETQQILIFGVTLENWGIWYTAIGLIITAFWSMYQFTKSVARKQQEKASDIATNFADDIIEKMGLISDVLMPNGQIQDMLKKLDTSKLSQFTLLEMLNIFKDEKYLESYFTVIHSKNTQKRYKKILCEKYNEKERDKFDSRFTALIDNTLNKLEAICINISSKAAGSQFIYESLHQMFLSTIEILAIRISSTNDNNVDKYYTNIISVYNMWNAQKKIDIEKLNKTQKKVKKLENKVNKEIDKLLTKEAKTV